MKMTKKSFLTIKMMLLFVLAMSNNTAMAGVTIGGPSDWYYVNFETRVSTPSCGNTTPGQVKLNYTNTDREQDNPWIISEAKPTNPYAEREEFMDWDATNAWEYGIRDAVWDKKNGNAQYTTKSSSVPEKYESTIYINGYDAAWEWYATYYKAAATEEEQKDMMMNYPLCPYTNLVENTYWEDAFESGSSAAEYGNALPVYDYTTSIYDSIYTNQWIYYVPDKYGNQYRNEGSMAGYNWYKSGYPLNEESPTAWGTSASLNGYAMIHMEDMDSLYGMSSYAYFEAKARENDGWYFTGWSYTEGESDLGGHVDTDTEEDKGYLFKIFPSDKQGWDNKSKVYAYATFKPVMVSDYKVTGLINGTGNSTTVVFDAVGDRVTAEDFTVNIVHATNGDSDGNWSAAITSCEDNKVTVTVTYSGAANGEFRGNVTLASKSGCSQLTAAVYARVGGASGKEASLYNTKVLAENLVESGDLTALIAKASATQIVALNADYDKTLTISKDVTIFTNGYSISSLAVTAGTVTFVYDKYNGGATAVSVTGGKLVLNGGEFGTLNIGTDGEVEQNGATFTGVATNNGILTANEGLFNAGLTSSKTLTVNNGTFNGETAITVAGGTADIIRGTIKGTACGLKVTGGAATIKKLAAIKGGTYSAQQTGGTLTIECGKFDGALNGTIDFTSGYFKDKAHAESVETGKDWMQLTNGVEYNEGYRFFLGNSETGKTNGVGVCRIGDVSYSTLEAALAYANNKPDEELVIFMTNNYTLPAGYYTLPAKATLVVPMSDTQAKINLTAPRLVYNDVNNAETDKYTNNIPSEFRCLTFAKGVNIDVFGKIELTCTQYQSNEAYTGQPVGAYGHLVMAEGSHMTLQSGSELRAWGFMTGKGETDARRGATVREMFQMGDWKGAMTSVAITGMVAGTGMEGIVKSAIGGADSGDFSDKKIFPVSQYFIQNVESPVKYHPGALLSTSAAVSEGVMGMSISMAATDIAIVGVSNEHTAIFLMDIAADADNTWVRKWYDAENDVQVYDINSGAHIGSMELDMGGLNLMGFSIPVKLNSAKFDLPITSNMKIHLLTGGMDFEQNTSLLPGSEVEVDKESTVSISMNKEDKAAKAAGTADHVYHSGAVYVYDQNEWDTYAYNTKYTKVVRYTPSASNGEGGQPNVRNEDSKPASAKINVHGTFNTKDGYVYTSATGANIFSNNEDAGTFIFNNAGGEAGERDVYQIKGKGNRNAHYVKTTFTCAQLRNSDDSPTETTSAIPGFAFIYRDGKWQEPVNEELGTATFNMDCYTAEISMAAYQEIIGDEEHQENQLKIAICHAPDNIAEYLMASKVAANLPANQGGPIDLSVEQFAYAKAHSSDDHSEDTENQAMFALFAQLYPTIAPQVTAIKDAGYDLGPAVQKLLIKPQEWVEIAGTAHAKFMFDVDDFETMYDQGVQEENYDLCEEAVTAYMQYFQAQLTRPYMESVEGNADHTFSDADGAGRLFIRVGDDCQWWEVEKKDNLYHCIHPNNDTYYYWDEDEGGWVEKRFTITWKNWDNSPIITKDMDGNDAPSYDVPYGTVAEFLGTNPTREETVDYTYDFTGWSPALDSVKSDVTYTATYTQKPRTYTIIFLNEGGVEIERQFLTLNEWPVCENTPTKVGHTLEWTPAIAAVTRDTTYTATWLEEVPEKYEITFFDYDGKEILQQGNVNVGDMPAPPADPTGKPETSEFTYVFDHWSPAIEAVSIDGPKSYTAVYREVAQTYTVTFLDEPGNKIESNQYAYGETPVCSVTPTKSATAQYTYKFAWDPQIQTVMGDATYRAVFTPEHNIYTVTLKANPSGACTFAGAGSYRYGTDINITISETDNDSYTFLNWTDAEGNEVSSLPTSISGDICLVANFEVANPDYTITWKSEDGNTTYKTVGQKAGTATTYTGATPTKAATAQNTFTFYGWTTRDIDGNILNTYKNGMTPKAAGDATYYAYFKEEVRKYTISWKNENGADIEVDYNQPYGAVIEYNSAAPTKSPDALYSYTFDGWTDSKGGDVVSLPTTVTGNAAFYAHFNAVSVVPVVEETLIEAGGEGEDEVTISSYVEADRLIVHEDGKVTVTASATVDEFIIESNGTNSGEVIGAANITAANAYFDLEMEMDALTWYAVAVPWEVDATKGIIVNGSPLRLVTDIDVLYYDGESRAANGTGAGISNWKYVADLGDKTLNPGTLYMIYLANPTSSIRFKKKAGASISTTELSVQQHTSQTGSDIDAGWNGIANPALYHAFINAGASTVVPGEDDTQHPNYAQKYVPGVDRYESFVMTTKPLIVGEPVFVQVKTSNTISAYETKSGAGYAPRRAPRVDNAYYEVQISAGEAYTDRLYLQTLEDKEDRYVIGLDLAKAGVSNKVAQMWVNRYNAKLCVNTTAPVGKTATYPLGISIPANGTYQISSATEMQANQELYVTRNGSAIWNLAYGPYTVTLDKGTYSEYGIKLIQSNAPAVTTGVDQTTNEKLQIQKVLIDNKVYIVRDGALYTITGQKIN